MIAAPADSPPEDAALTNVHSEAALLGALMLNNAIYGDILELVASRDFSEPLHQRIFDAIGDEIGRGRLATSVTLRPAFESDPAIASVGGVGYLAQLTGSSAVSIGARSFAAQIADLAKMRRLYARTQEVLVEMMGSGEVNPSLFANRIEAIAYDESAPKVERSRAFTMAESIDQVEEQIRKIQAEGKPIGAIAPDIPELEEAIGPLQRQHLHIWAGRPGMGKSALMCGAARSMAQAGYGVGVVSLEMGEIDLGQRFAADVAYSFGEEILHSRIRDAKLDDRELRVLAWAADQVREYPIRLVDVSGINMARLSLILRRMKRELEAKGQSLDVAFVDYLQLLHADRRTDNRVSDITEVSSGLKRLAKELNISIVALSQLSRAVEQRENKRPQLSDLRESGSIEQDADTVLFVFRESYYLTATEPHPNKHAQWVEWDLAMRACRDDIEFIVPKRRGGATGSAKAKFLRHLQAIRGRDHVGGELFDGA